MKREVDLVVISDVHLGTYGCHAKELLQYMQSVQPKSVILNGDIIDIWQFKKSYWPKEHMLVIRHILKWVAEGVHVSYITGNHDEMMRKFVGSNLGSLEIVNKKVMYIDGKSFWIFHGDVFDVTMQYSKWLAKLGSVGYDLLILLNRAVNYFSIKMGKGKMSLSKKIKNGVKSAVKFINKFEETAADIAIHNGYDYVICGHIHQPEMREIVTDKGKVQYLNSGDWIENLTCLEYHEGAWTIYNYNDDSIAQNIKLDDKSSAHKNDKELFTMLMEEFKIKVG